MTSPRAIVPDSGEEAKACSHKTGARSHRDTNTRKKNHFITRSSRKKTKKKTFPRTVTNYIKSESLLKVFTLGSKIATLVTFSTGSLSHCTVSNEAD